jgi:UDP-N-acetylglucosamine--N-acetylmuramyl-(pentapeptide) pyrophosphoryl-undecaprenol N-acetylglucosamine transferase
LKPETSSSSILFAGGGTGGHLFPSLAIAERLREIGGPAARFLCSDRAIDRQILAKAGVDFTPCPMRPLPTRPWQAPTFLRHMIGSRRLVKRMIRDEGVRLVVAMGGFVSVPAALAAKSAGIPVMLVNLDAIPGKANCWIAARADIVHSVYPSPLLPAGRTQAVALPLRRSCLTSGDARRDRLALGLEADKPMLLVTGASQGARSINVAIIEMLKRGDFRAALAGWQVMHLAGEGTTADLTAAYQAADVPAKVVEFCDQMGSAWGGAEVAISRAGANSVAEVAANGVPTVFLPYPYHKDQHQKLNAAPLVNSGAALMFEDAIEPAPNAERLTGPLIELLTVAAKRQEIRDKLRASRPADGAKQLAEAAVRRCTR